MRVLLGAVALILALVCRAGPAAAVIAIPTATPVAGAGSVDLVEQGTYAGTAPDTPYAGADFTLDLILPSEVAVTPDPAGAFIIDASGSYTDDGVTTTFSDQMELVSINSDYVEFDAENFLIAGDFFSSLMYLTSSILEQPEGDDTDIISIVPGTYSESTNPEDLSSASYNPTGDPPIIDGGVTITPAAVPEPSSLVLFAAALAGLAAIGRRRRAAPAARRDEC